MKPFIVIQVSVMAVVGYFTSLMLCYQGMTFVVERIFEAWVKVTAGWSALDCGRIGVEDDPAAGVGCARNALKSNAPFMLILEHQGIDSRIASAVAREAKGDVYRFRYDSAPCGGRHCLPAMKRAKCGDAWIDLQPSNWRPGVLATRITGCEGGF